MADFEKDRNNEILFGNLTFSQQDLLWAYKNLALNYHPDRTNENIDDVSTEKFCAITAAFVSKVSVEDYEDLGDEEVFFKVFKDALYSNSNECRVFQFFACQSHPQNSTTLDQLSFEHINENLGELQFQTFVNIIKNRRLKRKPVPNVFTEAFLNQLKRTLQNAREKLQAFNISIGNENNLNISGDLNEPINKQKLTINALNIDGNQVIKAPLEQKSKEVDQAKVQVVSPWPHQPALVKSLPEYLTFNQLNPSVTKTQAQQVGQTCASDSGPNKPTENAEIEWPKMATADSDTKPEQAAGKPPNGIIVDGKDKDTWPAIGEATDSKLAGDKLANGASIPSGNMGTGSNLDVSGGGNGGNAGGGLPNSTSQSQLQPSQSSTNATNSMWSQGGGNSMGGGANWSTASSGVTQTTQFHHGGFQPGAPQGMNNTNLTPNSGWGNPGFGDGNGDWPKSGLNNNQNNRPNNEGAIGAARPNNGQPVSMNPQMPPSSSGGGSMSSGFNSGANIPSMNANNQQWNMPPGFNSGNQSGWNNNGCKPEGGRNDNNGNGGDNGGGGNAWQNSGSSWNARPNSQNMTGSNNWGAPNSNFDNIGGSGNNSSGWGSAPNPQGPPTSAAGSRVQGWGDNSSQHSMGWNNNSSMNSNPNSSGNNSSGWGNNSPNTSGPWGGQSAATAPASNPTSQPPTSDSNSGQGNYSGWGNNSKPGQQWGGQNPTGQGWNNSRGGGGSGWTNAGPNKEPNPQQSGADGWGQPRTPTMDSSFPGSKGPSAPVVQRINSNDGWGKTPIKQNVRWDSPGNTGWKDAGQQPPHTPTAWGGASDNKPNWGNPDNKSGWGQQGGQQQQQQQQLQHQQQQQQQQPQSSTWGNTNVSSQPPTPSAWTKPPQTSGNSQWGHQPPNKNPSQWGNSPGSGGISQWNNPNTQQSSSQWNNQQRGPQQRPGNATNPSPNPGQRGGNGGPTAAPGNPTNKPAGGAWGSWGNGPQNQAGAATGGASGNAALPEKTYGSGWKGPTPSVTVPKSATGWGEPTPPKQSKVDDGTYIWGDPTQHNMNMTAIIRKNANRQGSTSSQSSNSTMQSQQFVSAPPGPPGTPIQPNAPQGGFNAPKPDAAVNRGDWGSAPQKPSGWGNSGHKAPEGGSSSWAHPPLPQSKGPGWGNTQGAGSDWGNTGGSSTGSTFKETMQPGWGGSGNLEDGPAQTGNIGSMWGPGAGGNRGVEEDWETHSQGSEASAGSGGNRQLWNKQKEIKVKRLMEMGLKREEAEMAVKNNSPDIDAAMRELSSKLPNQIEGTSSNNMDLDLTKDFSQMMLNEKNIDPKFLGVNENPPVQPTSSFNPSRSMSSQMMPNTPGGGGKGFSNQSSMPNGMGMQQNRGQQQQQQGFQQLPSQQPRPPLNTQQILQLAVQAGLISQSLLNQHLSHQQLMTVFQLIQQRYGQLVQQQMIQGQNRAGVNANPTSRQQQELLARLNVVQQQLIQQQLQQQQQQQRATKQHYNRSKLASDSDVFSADPSEPPQSRSRFKDFFTNSKPNDQVFGLLPAGTDNQSESSWSHSKSPTPPESLPQSADSTISDPTWSFPEPGPDIPDFGPPEFKPGVPWKPRTKDIENDPDATPGSVNGSLFSSISSIGSKTPGRGRETDISGILTKPMQPNPNSGWPGSAAAGNTGPWTGVNPSTKRPVWSGGSSYDEQQVYPPTALTNQLWNVPLTSSSSSRGSALSRPPPGYGGGNVNRSTSWPAGGSRSWETPSRSVSTSGGGGGGWSSGNNFGSSSPCLILKNVPQDMDSVSKLCSQFGPMESFQVNQQLRAVMVRYRKMDDAIRAQRGLNNVGINATFAFDDAGGPTMNAAPAQLKTGGFGGNQWSAPSQSMGFSGSQTWSNGGGAGGNWATGGLDSDPTMGFLPNDLLADGMGSTM